jgi:hypothetical protein
MVTTMSGNVVMNPCASLAIAARPTAERFVVNANCAALGENAATSSGFCLHHALAYRFAKLDRSSLI